MSLPLQFRRVYVVNAHVQARVSTQGLLSTIASILFNRRFNETINVFFIGSLWQW